MNEAIFQSAFSKWAKHNIHTNMVCELKIVKGKRMPFSAIKEHQWVALSNAKHRNMVYKIPDVGFDKKPCDMVILAGCEAYFVIMFYVRGQKTFYMVDIDTLIRFRDNGFHSITEEEILSLADRTEQLA